MSNAPQGPNWFQASNGKWYPPQLPKPPQPTWLAPLAWLLFLGGFVVALVGQGLVGLILLGAVMALVGLVMLGVSGRRAAR